MKHLGGSLWEVPSGADAPETVLMLPFAGGSSYSMREWSAALPGFRVVVVQYPGRGARLAQPFASSVGELAAAVLADCRAHLGKLPEMLLGHSFGAIVSYELSVQGVAIGLRPKLLVVSGSPSPAEAAALDGPLGRPVHELDDAAFVESLLAGGGIPEEIRAHRELLELVLPSIRADFELGWTYVRAVAAPPVDCPLLVLGGESDPSVPRQALASWRARTTAGATIRTFPGGHFFFRDGLPTLTDEIDRIRRTSFSPR